MTPHHLIRLMATRGFAGRIGPEDREAIALANALRVATLEGRTGGPWTHVANEGKLSSRAAAALLKACGMLSGAPDYWFMGTNGGCIELKRPGSRPSALSPAQRDFRDWCQDGNVRWAMCCSADEALAVLEEWRWLRGT